MTCRLAHSWVAPLTLGLLALVPVPLLAQSRRPITGEGTEGFRALLAGKGLQPIDTVSELNDVVRADPQRVLIVVFRGADASGRLHDDGLDMIPFALKSSFVDRGGALFIATDRVLNEGVNLAFTGSVEGREIVANGRGTFYRNVHCPYVHPPRRGATPDLFTRPLEGPLAGGGQLTRVATNRPSCLGPKGELDVLGVFTAGTWREEDFAAENRDVGFAHGKRYESGGKFLLLSDHSVFINSMLLPHESFRNDNLVFASNCVDWLMQGPDGKRTYVFFMEDGEIWKRDDYNLTLQSLPTPDPEDIASFLWENRDLLWKDPEKIEAVLAALEESGVFTQIEQPNADGRTMPEEFLTDQFDSWQYVRALFILGAAGLLGYSAFAFLGSRYRFPKKVARLSYVLDRVRPRAGMLEQRLRSGLGRGQYYELARQKAREVFTALHITPAPEGPLPKVIIDAGWWQRGRIMRDLRDVWAVAFGATPVAITARQWDPWNKKLNKLALQIRHGVVRFQ